MKQTLSVLVGYFGPDGGWHEDKPGTNPHDQPNGGDNGNHGLIGGNGGVDHNQQNAGGFGDQRQGGFGDQRNNAFDRGDQRNSGFYRNQGFDRNHGGFDRGSDRNQGRVNQPRNYMSGNADRDRQAAFRGRQSMHQAAMHQPPPHPQHVSAPHSGGGRRR